MALAPAVDEAFGTALAVLKRRYPAGSDFIGIGFGTTGPNPATRRDREKVDPMAKTLNDLKILVVEDNKSVLKMMKAVFRSIGLRPVYTEEDGIKLIPLSQVPLA